MKRLYSMPAFLLLAFLSLTGMTQTTDHTCGAEDIHNPEATYGEVSDIDGNTYKTVIIDDKIWFSENLKVSRFQDGSAIPEVTDATQWSELTGPGMCFYQNDPEFECPYGRLYNFYTAVDSRNPCPNGWRVPSMEDVYDLIFYLDPNANSQQPGNTPNTAGGPLKSEGLSYWRVPNTGATNLTGFSAIPNGGRNNQGLFSLSYDAASSYWMATAAGANNAMGFFIELAYPQDYLVRNAYWSEYGACIRCVTDVGVQNLNDIGPSDIRVFPNPSSELVNLTVPSSLIGQEYTITDMMGRLTLTGRIVASGTTISIAEFPVGIYLLRLPEQDGLVVKLVKQ